MVSSVIIASITPHLWRSYTTRVDVTYLENQRGSMNKPEGGEMMGPVAVSVGVGHGMVSIPSCVQKLKQVLILVF